jgi:hypothetical protein
MKMEEISITDTPEERFRNIMRALLDIPLDDFIEFDRALDKMNALAATEDNGKIMLSLAQESVSLSIEKHRKPGMNMADIFTLTQQFYLQFGFTLGYFYRSSEQRKRVPFDMDKK